MIKRYDESNYHELQRTTVNGMPEAMPRRTAYASHAAEECGLVPLLDYPSLLIDLDDLRDVIEAGRANRIFPQYHQEAAGWAKTGWNQDGYGFCWAYGLTAAVMDCREAEGKLPIRLAPFSLGWLVNWRDAGFYLDEAIKGARDRGIASAAYVPEYSLSYRKYKAGWEKNARFYRPLEWWDTDKRSDSQMLQQCATILDSGRPCYVAYNWWGHALELVGLTYDTRLANNVAWVLRNSHAEDDFIELTGSRGVPDEAYGVRATSLAI